MTTSLTKNADLTPAQHSFDPSILAGQVRPSTITMYGKAWKDYAAFAGNWAVAVLPETLARWRADLATRDLSPNTITG